jgi:hypothetical protein
MLTRYYITDDANVDTGTDTNTYSTLQPSATVVLVVNPSIYKGNDCQHFQFVCGENVNIAPEKSFQFRHCQHNP